MKVTLEEQPVAAPAAATRSMTELMAASQLSNRAVPTLTFVISIAALLLGFLSLAQNTYEDYPIPLLGVLCVVLQIQFLDTYRRRGVWSWRVLLLSGLAFVILLLLQALPEYVTGQQLNVIIHRSLFSAIGLFVVAIPAMAAALYEWFGATPRADDIAHYPLVVFPIVLVLGLYIVLIAQLLSRGTDNIDWHILGQPYFNYSWPVKEFIAGDWPRWTAENRIQAGLSNFIAGTFLLMILTTLISLPIGVGAGLYLSEYGGGRLGSAIRFTVSSLRAVSLLILGLTAYSLAKFSGDTPLAGLLRGTYFNGWDERIGTGGSFLTASIALALLIIPLIMRATEEGAHSTPSELREGSLALGASEQTTLRRIVIPWALPNIVTAVLLGCAEAGGSVAVLMFIAGRGDYGIGLTRQVTSLAYFIFDSYYGDAGFRGMMMPYQFTAGLLLLIITLSLGVLALWLKHRLARRHRGV